MRNYLKSWYIIFRDKFFLQHHLGCNNYLKLRTFTLKTPCTGFNFLEQSSTLSSIPIIINIYSGGGELIFSNLFKNPLILKKDTYEFARRFSCLLVLTTLVHTACIWYQWNTWEQKISASPRIRSELVFVSFPYTAVTIGEDHSVCSVTLVLVELPADWNYKI